MTSLLAIIAVLLACVALNEALQCYSHDLCSANCPPLADTIKTCSDENDKCYKAAFPGGVSRGCGKERCNVQINANSMLANVCCEGNLCNSAITWKLTWSTFFMVIGVWIFARM